MQSFKKLMSLRETIFNEILKDLIGSEKLCIENIMDRKKSHINPINDEAIKYRRQTSNTFIT